MDQLDAQGRQVAFERDLAAAARAGVNTTPLSVSTAAGVKGRRILSRGARRTISVVPKADGGQRPGVGCGSKTTTAVSDDLSAA